MSEEKSEGPPDKEVQEILSDLDAILSDLGGGPGPASPTRAPEPPQPPKAAAPAPKPPAPPPAAPPAPKPSPAPPPRPVVEAPRPPAAPAVPTPIAPAPKLVVEAPRPPAALVTPPRAPSAPPGGPIELGTRSLPPTKPAEKTPAAPPKPAAPDSFSGKPSLELGLEGPAKAGPARPASPAPAPAAIPAAAAAAALPPQRGLPPAETLPDVPAPEKVGKDQIRRVAFLYLRKFEAERDTLAKSLDQTAQTVPKKPLFLRRVLYQAVTEDCESKEVLARVLQAKAVAVLGVVEGLSEARLRDLGETLAGGGVMFRSVAPLDAGKKSVAIDIVVDVMLLTPEAP